MISEPTAVRNYSLTDAELAMFASNLVQSMTRDTAEFATFAIGPADIAAFQALGNSFEVFPSDEMLQADVMIATQAKDALRDSVLISARNISLRAKTKWGENSPQYRKFMVVGMNSLNDKELLFVARRVHIVGTEYLAQLASEGLTVAILDAFTALNQDFEDSQNEQFNKINERDVKTRERINLGNEVYRLVSKYCEIGKQIWESVNESKYNDYVIYSGGSSGLPGKIHNLIYTPATHTLTWTANPDALTYEVEISPDGAAWSLVYDETDPEAHIGKPPGNWYARCRGINTKGSGAWSDVLSFIVPVGVPNIFDCVYQAPNNRVVLQWNAVSYADYYEVWQCIVASGQPAGTFAKASEPSSPLYYHNSPPADMRVYYYVIGVNTASGIKSDQSNVVFAEIPV